MKRIKDRFDTTFFISRVNDVALFRVIEWYNDGTLKYCKVCDFNELKIISRVGFRGKLIGSINVCEGQYPTHNISDHNEIDEIIIFIPRHKLYRVMNIINYGNYYEDSLVEVVKYLIFD